MGIIWVLRCYSDSELIKKMNMISNRPHETSYYLQGSKKLNSPVFMKRKHKTMSFIISMI